MPIRSQVSWPNIHGHYHTNHVHIRYKKHSVTNLPPPEGDNPNLDVPLTDTYWTWIYSTFGKDWDNTSHSSHGGDSTSYWFPQGWYMRAAPGGLYYTQPRLGPPHSYWPSDWLVETNIEDVTKMEGFKFTPHIEGGRDNDERIWGLPKGCKINLGCPEWAQGGEPWMSTSNINGTVHTHYFIGHENPKTFYGLNCTYLTSGDNTVGDIVTKGQAQGNPILSHTGAQEIADELIIDCSPGRVNETLQPFEDEWQQKGVDNLFNMKDYGSAGQNSFYLNLTFYPRVDPHGTYSGIYQKINDEDPNGDFFESDLVNKYVFRQIDQNAGTSTQYAWIPQLSKVTGFIGGYLWHTIKQLSNTGIHPKDSSNNFHIRHSYRDIGLTHDIIDTSDSEVGKDGIGRFFNFTGEEAKVCLEPGANLTTKEQHASGLVYTGGLLNTAGHIQYTGGINYNWNRQDFASGNFANYLDNIVNYGAPEGMLAPSTGIVNQIARLFERKEPLDLYSGQGNWNICQDPLISRPAMAKITWKPTHRGSAHAALFIEPANYENGSWDFDYSGFQIGDGIIGVHSGRLDADFSRDSNAGSSHGSTTMYINQPFMKAIRAGNGVTQYYDITEPSLGPALTDGFHPISHFYHHDFGLNSENVFKDVYSYAPTLSWYLNETGTFINLYNDQTDAYMAGYGYVTFPQNIQMDHWIPAPFRNYQINTNDVSSPHTNYDTQHNSVCYHTYIPIEAGFQYVDRPLEKSPQNNVRQGVPIKACGHRFMSGIRTVGVIGDEEQSSEVLPYTRNRRTVPSGGVSLLTQNDFVSNTSSSTNVAGFPYFSSPSSDQFFVETGQIVPPKFELSLPWGDIYTFNITGWANYCFPQDKTKPVQFITGFPFNCSRTEIVKPRIKKWFCPTDKTSILNAKASETQEINFSSTPIGGDSNFFATNACVLEPPIYKYDINIINGTWAYIDGSKSSPGPRLTFHNTDGKDLQYLTPNRHTSDFDVGGGIGLLGENFYEGKYELYCGDIIGQINYWGKINDGFGFGTHTETNMYDGANYYNMQRDGWVYPGDGGQAIVTVWTTGTQTHDSKQSCSAGNSYDATLTNIHRPDMPGTPIADQTLYGGNFAQINLMTEASRKILDLKGYKDTKKELPENEQPGTDPGEEPVRKRYPYDFLRETPEPAPADKETKVINIQIEQPNRGMVHFDNSKGFFGAGENDKGWAMDVWLNDLKSLWEIEWYGECSDTYHKMSVPACFTFYREWRIEPKDRCHGAQTFSMPFYYKYVEHSHISWSEPQEYDMGEGCEKVGGYEVRNIKSLHGDDDNTYYDADDVRAEDYLHTQAHYITQAWCPIVFHPTTGAVDRLVSTKPGFYGWSYEAATEPYPIYDDSFSDYVYETPDTQMPFPKRLTREEFGLLGYHGTHEREEEYAVIGNRYYQEFPVILEFWNYGDFYPDNCGCQHWDGTDAEGPGYNNVGRGYATQVVHPWDGEGTAKGCWRVFQDQEYAHYASLTSEQPDPYGFVNPIKHEQGPWISGPGVFSKLTKEGMTYNDYDGQSNNFCLRLVPGLTYEVVETSYVIVTPAYHNSGDGYWSNGKYGENLIDEAYKTRTGYFSTNASKFLSNQKHVDDSLGVEPHNVGLERIYQTKENNPPHQSGYCQYQETLDENVCTFNVRSKNPSPFEDRKRYIQPPTGSFNCDAGEDKSQHILLPCFDTIITSYNNCEARTYKGMDYNLCSAEYTPCKTVLNAGLISDMMPYIEKQHNLEGLKDLNEQVRVGSGPLKPRDGVGSDTFTKKIDLRLADAPYINYDNSLFWHIDSGINYNPNLLEVFKMTFSRSPIREEWCIPYSTRHGVAEAYTTLELGQSTITHFAGEAGEFDSSWHAYTSTLGLRDNNGKLPDLKV